MRFIVKAMKIGASKVRCKWNSPQLADLRWEEVARISVDQGVAPFLFWRMKKDRIDGAATAGVVEKLKAGYYANLAANTVMLEEMRLFLSRLKRAGIDAIVLKGAFLVDNIYKNPGIRPMSDFDLLVRVENFKDACSLALKSGFKLLEPKNRELTMASSHSALFEKGSAIRMEVHHDFARAGRFNVEMTGIWERARKHGDGGGLELSPEDIILYQALHMAAHGFRTKLLWWMDTNEIMKRYSPHFDEEFIKAKAREGGYSTALYLMLRIHSMMFGWNPFKGAVKLKPAIPRRLALNILYDPGKPELVRFKMPFRVEQAVSSMLLSDSLSRFSGFIMKYLKERALEALPSDMAGRFK